MDWNRIEVRIGNRLTPDWNRIGKVLAEDCHRIGNGLAEGCHRIGKASALDWQPTGDRLALDWQQIICLTEPRLTPDWLLNCIGFASIFSD